MPRILTIPKKEPYPSAMRVAKAMHLAGGRALIVGGGVRDALLHITSPDIDMEVHGLSPGTVERVARKLGRVNAVGKSFGVFKLTLSNGTTLDISLPRKDSKVAPGHRGFRVHTDQSLTLAQAAKRRDFTINAIAWDPLNGEILDPWGGESDLRARRLRVTDPETFADDPLRVLRAVQMIGRFGLRADPETQRILKKTARSLHELPRERRQEEWKKLFLKSTRPSLGLRAANTFGVLRWTQGLAAIDRAAHTAHAEDWSEHERWIVLLAVATIFYPKALEIFGIDSVVKSTVERIVNARNAALKTDGDLRRIACTLSPATVAQWLRAQQAQHPRSSASHKRLRTRAKALDILDKPPKDIISGKDLLALGFPSGPMLGRIIALANRLRDDHNATRHDILKLIHDAKNPPSAIKRMEDLLSQRP